MEPECYKIEILHYINPHLIWVEVKEPQSENEFSFEQIGIYGVLPLDCKMSLAEGTLVSSRSTDWARAAALVIEKALVDAVEVTFYPVYIDHRTTIFDDNNHKYGEIIIKKPNGKYRVLSKLLAKSDFAAYNENAFQKELSAGNIKTKLSHYEMKDIIKKLEKKCKKQVSKQTQVFQLAENLESTLTVKNLAAHNRRTQENPAEKYELFQRKLEDLQLCKDVEEEGVGRATKKKDKSSDTSSSLLQRKLKLHREKHPEMQLLTSDVMQKDKQPVTQSSDVKSFFIKQRLKDLHAMKKLSKDTKPGNSDNSEQLLTENLQDLNLEKNDETENSRHVDSARNIDNSNTRDNDFIKKHNQMNTLLKLHKAFAKMPSSNEEKDFENARKYVENLTEVTMKKVKVEDKLCEDQPFEDDCFHDFKPKKTKKRNTNKPNKIPEYNIEKEARIVYLPPGTNRAVLPCKIVARDEFTDMFALPEPQEEFIPMKEEREDIFNAEDSDVEVESTRRHEKIDKSKEVDSDVVSKKCIFDDPKVFNFSAKTRGSSKDISPPKAVTHKLEESFDSLSSKQETSSSLLLKLKLRHHKEKLSLDVSGSTTSDTSNKDSSTSIEDDRFKSHKKSDVKLKSSSNLDSDEELSEVIKKINLEYKPLVIPKKEEVKVVAQPQLKNHVNPFKNIDKDISKFVDKLVTPVLMVHSKMNKRFQPTFDLRDVPFNSHIQIVLKNINIDRPMMLQTVTWSSILRGYSTFMISPKRSGKTIGYLPAVCRLVADNDSKIDGVGPISIVVCATSNSVSEVEHYAKLFLESKKKVLAIYSGMNELHVATSLLNGCDMLICTPAILIRLLQTDFGVDLRRLTSFVLDDCERLAEVFSAEIKFFLYKIKDMLKNRVQKEIKVQYILSSRVWCDFMEPLARKAPDTVISIGAFQECVLYSKANTIATFVTKENKIQSVLDFLKDIDTSKKTVIVCRKDEEVEELKEALTHAKYVVFACDSQMTVQDLYKLRGSWDDYQEPVIGPILVCLDGNLTHLNVTDAHYLVHYSLPNLFSAFCKRFSAINENYPSIFKADNETVKIKILLEESNVEQLPKILHFIKRCTTEVPAVLDDICQQVLIEKDKTKAQKLVPICDNLLTLGECPDTWNCQERHAVVKQFDEPKDWVPKEGMVTFKILHYHTAVLYSARLLSSTTKGLTMNYPQNYNMLSMKISMYFGRESNRKLHSEPEVGDVCAVAIKQNFFARCQVVKILSSYQNGKPNYVLVRLIDEERLERTRDIYLYYLPEELKKTQTHVVHVRLANLQPKDKDISFSDLAKNELQKITDGEEDLYMTGKISLTIGNCVILESLEACRDLSTLNKTVVLHDFKKVLLENHALPNEEHLQKLIKLCKEGGMEVTNEKAPKIIEVPQPEKTLPAPQWAHLEKGDLSTVLFASAEDPSTFFVRLVKFEDSCTVLIKDIQKYVAENSETLTNVSKGDIVLAKLPDDGMFERARIDEILDGDKVKCFFVDHGDWREVSKQDLVPITEKLITQLPFQAIECKLLGVKPPGQNWTEFVTIWFSNCFEDSAGNLKQIYAKYFTKEKASCTDGHKYGVVLIDTNSDQDIIINELIMEVNLAQVEDSEIKYLNELDFKKETVEIPKELSDNEDDSWERVSKASKTSSITDDFEQPNVPLSDLFPKKPIRSVPLIGSDESETSEDRWQINMTEDFISMFKPVQKFKTSNFIASTLPAIKNADSKSSSEVSVNEPCKNQAAEENSSDSNSESSAQKSSATDVPLVSVQKIKELDSDDYTSSESALITTKTTENEKLLKEVATTRITKEPKQIKEDNLSKNEKEEGNEQEKLRKPKLLWHQKKKNVVIKIMLIGVEKYDLTIEERRIKFYAIANDTEYGFDLELYGIIDKKAASHSNKGQYIRVELCKLMERNWLTLTKSCSIQKWIVYDVDALDVDSSDEEDGDDMSKDVIRKICDDNDQVNSDSEDEEFLDDVNFGYSR